jgi:glycolate oxidase
MSDVTAMAGKPHGGGGGTAAPRPLVESLRDALGNEAVLGDPDELVVYECDGFTISRARPLAVVFPTSTEQVVKAVNVCRSHGVAMMPRGSGTGLTGGIVAVVPGVQISTARMNKILQVDLRNRWALVEAGVTNSALSVAIQDSPYHFAPDPSSQRASTIGGNASTNAGGIHTLKDFVSSNHVLGMEMVLPDGQVIEVGGKEGCYETGNFDLPGLICGHEGTFGIVTRLWVRLVPKATSFRTMVTIFSTTADACNMVSDVIAAGMLPAAMEMMDGSMVQIVEDAFQMGFPRDAQALVLTELDGIPELLDEQMEQLAQACRRHHATSVQSSADPQTRARLWKARKSAFGAIGRISHSYCTQDACVPRSMLAGVLGRIDEIGKEHGLQITNVFHAGDGNVHPIFLYDERDESQVRNTLLAAEKMLKYCIDIGGTLTGEHGVGVEKIHLMPYLFDQPTMEQFGRVKSAFDPDERINAGKMIPSDKVNITLLKPGRMVPQ